MTEEQRANAANIDDRFKQLDLLIKLIDARTALYTRVAYLLIVGNAGGVALCILVIKDLSAKFSELFLVVSSAIFAIGVLLASFFYFGFTAHAEAKGDKVIELIVGKGDLDKVESAWSTERDDSMLWFCGIGAGLAFFFGALSIMTNLVAKRIGWL